MKRLVAAVAAVSAAVSVGPGALPASAATAHPATTKSSGTHQPTSSPSATSKTVGSGVAGPGDLTAAAAAFKAGTHVFVGPDGAPVDVALLNGFIGSQPIFVAVLGPSHDNPDQSVATLSAETRRNGTYVLLDGVALRATTNVFPPNGVQAVLEDAQAAHPTDPVSAVEDFVQHLAAGAAKTAQPPTTPADPAVAAQPAARGSQSRSLSPWFLALLVPLGAAVGFAVARARRRTG
ncbi:MAG: hypothetical protein QOI42_2260 [Frankiaceae bacterium]|jgi:hypothetical protein|nr:hypothetical protein [Frankiaceae bacterium]